MFFVLKNLRKNKKHCFTFVGYMLYFYCILTYRERFNHIKFNEALKNAKIEREVEDEKINDYIEKIDKDNFCNYIIRMSNNILDLLPEMYK